CQNCRIRGFSRVNRLEGRSPAIFSQSMSLHPSHCCHKAAKCLHSVLLVDPSYPVIDGDGWEAIRGFWKEHKRVTLVLSLNFCGWPWHRCFNANTDPVRPWR